VLPHPAKLSVFEEIRQEANSRLEQSFSLNLRPDKGTSLPAISHFKNQTF
jgi:hypothetical protein